MSGNPGVALKSIKESYFSGDEGQKISCIRDSFELNTGASRAFIVAVAKDRSVSTAVRDEAIFFVGLFAQTYLKVLKRLALDRTEVDEVRNRAADSIGDMFERCRKCRSFQTAVGILCQCLADPSPEVRFTACYSLGKMRAKSALACLSRLRQEDNAVSAYGSVSQQAGHSIDFIIRASRKLRLTLDQD